MIKYKTSKKIKWLELNEKTVSKQKEKKDEGSYSMV